MKIFRKILQSVLGMGLCLNSISSVPVFAEENVKLLAEIEAASSTNKFGHEYVNSHCWAENPTSHLLDIDGTLYRVELINEKLVVETYDPSYNLKSQKSLDMELPIWGGYHFDGQNNWLVFGKRNGEQKDSNEVVRIVKYSKDFSQRLGATSLYGSNISIPFSSGSIGFADSPDNSVMYVHSARQMYMKEDYLLHQSNFSLALDKKAMKITDQATALDARTYGYTSHSFNQFVTVNNQGEVVTLDHGDGHERALILHHARNDANSKTPFLFDKSKVNVELIESGSNYQIYTYSWPSVTIKEIPGITGSNVTGLSAGDFFWNGSNYLVAYNYFFDDETDYGSRKVTLSVVDPAFNSSKDVFTSQQPGTNPYLVLNTDGSGIMLWNGLDTTVSSSGYKHASQNETLYYVTFDKNGKTGSVKNTESAPLSGAHPILKNGKVIWYTTSNSKPVFYELNPSTGVVDSVDLNPFDPDAPVSWDSISFKDVSSSDPYFPAVRFVAYNKIMTGYEDGLFHPNDSLSRGMLATILWRMFGSPDLPYSGFADVPEWSFYKKASSWALATGLMTGNEHRGSANTFDGEDPVKRQDLSLIFYRLRNQPITSANSQNDLGSGHYAYSAVNWALNNNLITPVNGSFSGTAPSTRIITANFLYQFVLMD